MRKAIFSLGYVGGFRNFREDAIVPKFSLIRDVNTTCHNLDQFSCAALAECCRQNGTSTVSRKLLSNPLSPAKMEAVSASNGVVLSFAMVGTCWKRTRKHQTPITFMHRFCVRKFMFLTIATKTRQCHAKNSLVAGANITSMNSSGNSLFF